MIHLGQGGEREEREKKGTSKFSCVLLLIKKLGEGSATYICSRRKMERKREKGGERRNLAGNSTEMEYFGNILDISDNFWRI